MFYLSPLIAGFTIVLSLVQNGRLSQTIGSKNTTLINFITGFLGTLIIFTITRESFSSYSTFHAMPLFAYVGGAIGVICVFIGSYVVNKISVIASTMLAYSGQLLIGIIIDAFIGTSLSPVKIIGCLLIVAGVYVNGFFDRQALDKAIA